MDFGSILAGLALLLLAGAFIGRPIFMKGGRVVTVEDRRLSELQAQRDRILNGVQELDLDFAMGKVIESDYKVERASLMTSGAQTLKDIDALAGAVPDQLKGASDVDEIEAAVARLRGKPAAGYCPTCGSAVQVEDAFCTRCGTSLQVHHGAAG